MTTCIVCQLCTERSAGLCFSTRGPMEYARWLCADCALVEVKKILGSHPVAIEITVTPQPPKETSSDAMEAVGAEG